MLDRDRLLTWLRDEIAANTEAMTSDSDTQADAAAMVVAWLSTLARGIEAGEFDVEGAERERSDRSGDGN